MKKVSFAKPITISFTKDVLQRIRTITKRSRITLEKALPENNTIERSKE